jgi:hypothetical protein
MSSLCVQESSILVVKDFFKSLELTMFKIASNCKNDSIWVLLALATKYDHKIHKINTKTKLLIFDTYFHLTLLYFIIVI